MTGIMMSHMATAVQAAGGGLIPASSLTAQGGLIAHFSPSLYFFTQGQANAFYAANPSTFYVVEGNGTQTKYEGNTLGAVTPNGPYWEIATSGGTATVGTYLSGASNSTIYYAPNPDITASIDFAYDASYNGGSFGYVRPEPPSQAGFGTIASQTPSGIIGSITYSPTYNTTTITFKTGTYTGGNGSLVVTTPWRINGQDGNYSVTIADETHTMSQGPSGYIGLLIAGDPFHLQSQFLIGNVAVEIRLA